ncbi:MAG TPA: hypothetical protein VMF05_09855 [Stellaceae bacterium]|nr:hypothetical protein [Stellaceae bacterium]
MASRPVAVIALRVMANGLLRGSIADLRRKLAAVTAVAADPAATEHEKATAKSLKARLQQALGEAGAPAGDWSDGLFRLGRWARKIGKPTAPGAAGAEWTDHARQLGKVVGRAKKKWRSD